MVSILNVFGKSPFHALKHHMHSVSLCVKLLDDLIEAILSANLEEQEAVLQKISKLEHKADLCKNEIGAKLRQSFFMPIKKQEVIEILSLQDLIADACEDIAAITSYKTLVFPEPLKESFLQFFKKNSETFSKAFEIIDQIDDLIESSFGGMEAEQVRLLIEETCLMEHESDVLQKKLIVELYALEKTLSYGSFFQLHQMFANISKISNLSESLALRIRLLLEYK